MVRNIHWHVAEVTEQTDELGWSRPRVQDLLPWADPYIAMLMASLERGRELDTDERA